MTSNLVGSEPIAHPQVPRPRARAPRHLDTIQKNIEIRLNEAALAADGPTSPGISSKAIAWCGEK